MHDFFRAAKESCYFVNWTKSKLDTIEEKTIEEKTVFAILRQFETWLNILSLSQRRITIVTLVILSGNCSLRTTKPVSLSQYCTWNYLWSKVDVRRCSVKKVFLEVA